MKSQVKRARHNAIQIKDAIRTRWVMRRCDSLGFLARICEGNVIVHNPGRMTIGAHTRFFGRFAPVELRTGDNGTVEIGERSSLRWGTSVSAADSVRIGSGTQIAGYCVISDVDAGGLDSPDPTPPRPVEIGNGVWLATRVIVLPGSTIGDGAVVGAGSVVDGHIPAYGVAVGAPAKVVRMLDGSATNTSDDAAPKAQDQ